MLMTSIEKLWSEIKFDLKPNAISEEECRFVKIEADNFFEIFAGVDGSGFVIFAFCVGARPPMIDFETGALDYFRRQRVQGKWLMALRLKSDGLEQVFGRLCQDLIDEATEVPTEAALISLFRDRLILWKRLFQQGNDGLLEPYQIKGLVAELLALQSFIADDPENLISSVVAWTGPSRADQDFLFPEKAVEIKAIAPFAKEVSIASAAQLEASVPLELHIYAFRDSAIDEEGAISLFALVTQLESQFSKSPSALRIFRQKLFEAGYVEHDYYKSIAYSLADIKRYFVSDQFPKFTQSMLPNGVVNITYSISIASIFPFQITGIVNAD